MRQHIFDECYSEIGCERLKNHHLINICRRKSCLHFSIGLKEELVFLFCVCVCLFVCLFFQLICNLIFALMLNLFAVIYSSSDPIHHEQQVEVSNLVLSMLSSVSGLWDIKMSAEFVSSDLLFLLLLCTFYLFEID